MKLQDTLDAIRTEFESSAPAEVVSIMHRVNDDLKNAGILEKALKVGDKVPDFILPDTKGNMVSLSSCLEKGPLVLTFFRGQWWPYCISELEALNKTLPQFKTEGAAVLAISPQRKPFNRQIVRDSGLDFEILADAGNRVAEAFGIVFHIPDDLKEIYDSFGVDLPRINGDDTWNLAIPARYVIGQNSVILSADVDPDYSYRTEPADTLAAVKKITEQK